MSKSYADWPGKQSQPPDLILRAYRKQSYLDALS